MHSSAFTLSLNQLHLGSSSCAEPGEMMSETEELLANTSLLQKKDFFNLIVNANVTLSSGGCFRFQMFVREMCVGENLCMETVFTTICANQKRQYTKVWKRGGINSLPPPSPVKIIIEGDSCYCVLISVGAVLDVFSILHAFIFKDLSIVIRTVEIIVYF